MNAQRTIAVVAVVTAVLATAARRCRASGPRGRRLERPAARSSRRRRVHEELHRSGPAVRRADPAPGSRHRRHDREDVQARDPWPRRRARGDDRASAERRDDHPRPLGRASHRRQDGCRRRVRRRLGHRPGSAADHGAPPRPRQDRGTRRAGCQRILAGARGQELRPQPCDGDQAQSAVRSHPSVGLEGPQAREDHRRVHRGDQRGVRKGRASDPPLDAGGRGGDRRADRRALRCGWRGRDRAGGLPGKAAGEARCRGRSSGLGGSSAARRSRGPNRRRRNVPLRPFDL